MDLVVYEREELVGVLNPGTGEVIDLASADREQIAGWYLAMLDWQANAAMAVRVAARAFAERSDKEATLSVVVDGRRVSVPGAADVFQLDHEQLRKALLALVADEKLTQQAADETCRPLGVDCPHCDGFVETGGYKTSLKALNNLRKQPGLAAVIDACGEYAAPVRPLKATRA